MKPLCESFCASHHSLCFTLGEISNILPCLQRHNSLHKRAGFPKKTFSYYKIYDRHSIAESLGILQFAAIEKNISRFVPLCRISSCLLHMCIPLFMFNKITSCLFARFPLNTIFVADDKVQNKATFSVLEFISSI